MFQISTLFPILAVAASALAYVAPGLFTPYQGTIVPLLTIIMFAMGLTLTPADFARVAKQPLTVGVGVLLQFTIMPLAALVIGILLDLPTELIAGMVLLGSCPGGTASNVICYLARSNVALSVSMTLVSSLLAVIATPTITWLLIGREVPVAVGSMVLSMVQIVLVPVLFGVILNTLFTRHIARIKPALPWVATLAIVAVLAVIVAVNHDELALAGLSILAAIILHNLTGYAGGYAIPRLLGFDTATCRTISIEVGMQNSGLATALALQYFSAIAALPGAIFSIWHSLSGALLASWWAHHSDDSPR